MHKEFLEALQKTKIQMMAREGTAFFTGICLRLNHVIDEEIPTACIDGKEIRYNPQYFLMLNKDERLSLLVHEIYHIITDTFGRKQHRQHKRWNYATDYANNMDMQSRGFVIRPGWLLNLAFLGMSAEQIYELLPESLPDNELDGDFTDAELTPEEKADVEEMITSAAIHAKAVGGGASIPTSVEIYLSKVFKPKLPWQRILSKYLGSAKATEYSYRKPNRRYWPDIYIPSMHSYGLDHIAIALDASGSVEQEEFAGFVAEIDKVLRVFKPQKISLVIFAEEIRSVHVIKSSKELMQVPLEADGGTCIEPVLDWVQENKPIVTMIMTDGYFYTKETNIPKQNIVWLMHQEPLPGVNPPTFGKIIRYKQG